MGLEQTPRPNPMGVNVNNNIGSTFKYGRLKDRATSQCNEHPVAAHILRCSFDLGIELKSAVDPPSLYQSSVAINDVWNLRHTLHNKDIDGLSGQLR